MSQSTISAFFKRKDGSNGTDTAVKRRRKEGADVVPASTTPPPLSARTRHWLLSDPTSTRPLSVSQQAVHAKFVNKLRADDSPQSSRRTSNDRPESDEVVESDPDTATEEDDDRGPGSVLKQKFALVSDQSSVIPTKNQRQSRKKTTSSTLTPLEVQILKIQEENPSTTLLVEVGYKFRFFGPDARKASQILGIACFKSRAFLTASIPTHRLYIHINRLVQAGLKVGVVRQMETAALKAIGDTRNKAFDRQLCEVYTKATYLNSDDDSHPGGWIISIYEKVDLLAGTDGANSLKNPTEPHVDPMDDLENGSGSVMPAEEVPKSRTDINMGMIAVRAESGEVLHDEFQDGPLRSEFEKRLILLEVSEIVIVGAITSSTRTVIAAARARVEEVVPTPNVKQKIEEFYHSRYSEEESSQILSKILQMSNCVLVCLAAQINYLSEFNLQAIFTLTNFFMPMENRMSMYMPATTLAALEIFSNTTNGTEYGSLFWLMNQTQTIPGKRLLRRWLAKPLSNFLDLQKRQEAVTEIIEAKGTSFEQIERARIMMRKLPDLEKGLAKVFYGTCARPTVLQVLQAFSRISRAFDRRENFSFRSSFLLEAFSSFSSVTEVIEGFLGEFHHVEAAKDDKYSKSDNVYHWALLI